MKPPIAYLAAISAFALVGCGSSQPEHQEQPLSARPPVESNFKQLKTKEEKIKYIQESKAPDSEKQRAIAEIEAGRL